MDPAPERHHRSDQIWSGEQNRLPSSVHQAQLKDWLKQGFCFMMRYGILGMMILTKIVTETPADVEFFATGKITGDASISPDGTEAEEPFLFGPDEDREETMKLINRDGQWYLFGF
jgi:hypothetical protein